MKKVQCNPRVKVPANNQPSKASLDTPVSHEDKDLNSAERSLSNSSCRRGTNKPPLTPYNLRSRNELNKKECLVVLEDVLSEGVASKLHMQNNSPVETHSACLHHPDSILLKDLEEKSPIAWLTF